MTLVAGGEQFDSGWSQVLKAATTEPLKAELSERVGMSNDGSGLAPARHAVTLFDSSGVDGHAGTDNRTSDCGKLLQEQQQVAVANCHPSGSRYQARPAVIPLSAWCKLRDRQIPGNPLAKCVPAMMVVSAALNLVTPGIVASRLNVNGATTFVPKAQMDEHQASILAGEGSSPSGNANLSAWRNCDRTMPLCSRRFAYLPVKQKDCRYRGLPRSSFLTANTSQSTFTP